MARRTFDAPTNPYHYTLHCIGVMEKCFFGISAQKLIGLWSKEIKLHFELPKSIWQYCVHHLHGTDIESMKYARKRES